MWRSALQENVWVVKKNESWRTNKVPPRASGGRYFSGGGKRAAALRRIRARKLLPPPRPAAPPSPPPAATQQLISPPILISFSGGPQGSFLRTPPPPFTIFSKKKRRRKERRKYQEPPPQPPSRRSPLTRCHRPLDPCGRQGRNSALRSCFYGDNHFYSDTVAVETISASSPRSGSPADIAFLPLLAGIHRSNRLPLFGSSAPPDSAAASSGRAGKTLKVSARIVHLSGRVPQGS